MSAKTGNPGWKVAFIGECMIELQRLADGSIHQNFGGDTFNTAAYFSRLGNPFGITAEYVSALGDDNFSKALRNFWNEENVASSLTRGMPGRRPGLYFIEVDERGERSFTYWRGEAAARDTFEEGEGDAVLAGLARFDAVYLSGISLAVLRGNGKERLLSRLGELRAKGMEVFFDCNFRPLLWPGGKTPVQNARPWYERILSLVDTVFIARDETAALGLPADADEEAVCAAVKAFGPSEIVLKNGSGVCVVAHEGGIQRVPALTVETVVDTTAAGDSFSAAYLVSRRLGYPPAESAGYSHILAAAVVSHKGAVIPKNVMPELFPG